LTAPITHIGKYQILEQIGEGAMGVVYRATDPVLNRTVAIKVMSEGLAHDEGLRARFLHEAQAAGSLQHPNVVTIYDFGETDGHLFIAMEFVEGADLEHLLDHNAPLSLSAKLDIIIDVLNGLSYAHRRGIVHRDIKPANIRINEDGDARIMDFGVARLPTSNLTKTGVMMGTPNYMAPEQITGEEVTPSCDLFSTGALLYELLTGIKPFQADTMHGVLFKIVSDPAPDVRALKPDIPEALSGIVKRALAKTPGERFHNATDMANALTAVRAKLGPARVSRTLADRVSHRSSIDKALRDRQNTNEHAIADARRWQMVGVSAASLLGVVIIGLLVFRRDPVPPAPLATAPASIVAAAPPPADTTPTRSTPALDTTSAATGPTTAKAQTPPSRTTPREDATRRPAAAPQRQERSADSRRVVTDTATAQPTSPAAVTQGTAVPPVTAPIPAPSVNTSSGTTSVVPSPPKVAPEPVNPRPAIAAIIAEYGRAIGTREVAEVRRVYPGMTAQQQARWESFFASVRSLTATFEIASLDVDGDSAAARITGMYEYVSRTGRTERQPVAHQATLQRDGDRWRLQTIR
jgi:predicted Ser/Thr protein kinase